MARIKIGGEEFEHDDPSRIVGACGRIGGMADTLGLSPHAIHTLTQTFLELLKNENIISQARYDELCSNMPSFIIENTGSKVN